MTSQPDQLIIAIHMLPNISQSKDTIKFGQLEYDKWNTFLQKSSRKWVREASSRPLFVF